MAAQAYRMIRLTPQRVAELDRMADKRTALTPMEVCERAARTACLRQYNGDHCICLSCIAKQTIEAHGESA